MSLSPVYTSFDMEEAVLTEDGRMCIIHTDMVESVSREPVLKCAHKMEQKCHKTHITFFTPSQEKVCEEYYEKKCKIIFNKKRVGESFRKCTRPQQKICDGTGQRECRTVYETACTTQVIFILRHQIDNFQQLIKAQDLHKHFTLSA